MTEVQRKLLRRKQESPGLHDQDPKRQGLLSLRKQMLTGDLTATCHYFDEISSDKGNLCA